MAQQINGTTRLLDAALGEWHQYGYNLQEDGDHFLMLYHHDTRIAVFSQELAPLIQIHKGCRRHFERHRCTRNMDLMCNVPHHLCHKCDCEVRFNGSEKTGNL